VRSFQDLQGNEVALGRFLGRGGEGAVYSVQTRAQLVAKIYMRTPDNHMGRKLAAMVQLGTGALTSLAAWPQDLLIDERTGNVVGFLMPRVEDHRGIHALYGPTNRKTAFPDATWAFLVRTARNVAATFDTVHGHGHVIGDVNEGNVVVSQEATVLLIDCDSFQITHLGRTYPCRVGVPLYTPPELQGQRLEDVVRTPDHDRFGLAVLVFQLLFMGRHPFAGLHPDRAIPVGMAIREGLFAFGREAARQRWKPPPFSLRLTDVSWSVAQIFEQAFGKEAAAGGPRPTAADWLTALDELEALTVICDKNPRHAHVILNDSCPWCRIEKEGGPSFFPTSKTAPKAVSRREILDAYEGLRTRTHFEVLDVPRTANDQQIKEAYFRLAKRFHPDAHHDSTVADLVDRQEAVFIRLGEAYETLRNARSRKDYEKRLEQARPRAGARTAAGSAAVHAPLAAASDPEADRKVAEEALRRGSWFYEEEKYWDAIQVLEPALELLNGKPLQRARVVLAKAYMKNPKWVRRGEETLQAVIQDDAQNVEAYYLLGVLYRDGGLKSRATTMFRKVRQLAEDAIREANELFENGKYWEAIQLLLPVTREVTGKPNLKARLLLARVFAANPKWRRKATELLQEVLRDDPQSLEARLILSHVYMDKGMTARADTLLNELSEFQLGSGVGVPPAKGAALPEQLKRIGVLVVKARQAFVAVERRLTAQEREWVLNAIDGVKTITGVEVDELKQCEETLERALRLLGAVRLQH